MLNELMELASENISGFSTELKYYTVCESEKITTNSDTNKVYSKDNSINDFPQNIVFSPNATNSKIFIGKGVKGSYSINIQQSNSIVYIGDYCNLRNVDIRTQALGSCVLIGNRVSTTGKNEWLTGSFPGSKYSSIVIGDDCLFSYDVTLRATDGHPIMSFDLTHQINKPHSFLVIEPYVWVGQNVTILKSTKIGAMSIIGSGSVVTRPIPRFSKAFGTPAMFEKLDGVWIKDRREFTINLVKKYIERYR